MKRAFTFVFVLLFAPLVLAATFTWDSAFEATPANSDPVSQGDDRIRDLKETIRDHLEVEHRIGPGAPDDTGRHREGSAVIWYEASDPSGNTTGDAMSGLTAYGTDDAGRMLRRSDTGELKVFDGSGWVQALTALSGTVNLINTPRFTTTGSAGDLFNPAAFHIRNIIVDTSLDTAGCISGSAYSTTNLASQTFGDAGVACYTTGSINLSTRSTTSRGIIIAKASNSVESSGSCTMGVFRDSMANQVGGLSVFRPTIISGTADNDQTVIAYVTGITAASHEFAVHFRSSTSNFCSPRTTSSPDAGFLMFIDLGPEI